MDVDTQDDVLRQVANGGTMDYEIWPTLLPAVLDRIDKIARTEFRIPYLAPGPGLGPQKSLSPVPSTEPPASQTSDADKENAVPAPAPEPPSSTTLSPGSSPIPVPADLPPLIQSMLTEITSTIASLFTSYPPHTVQRLAELVLYPHQHYKNLTAYLHALDRVVHVTSGANVYPLPPAIPDITTGSFFAPTGVNGELNISWANPATTAPTDEAQLGGALLTPIPWLMNSTPTAAMAAAVATTMPVGADAARGGGSVGSGTGGRAGTGSEFRTESTETIDGPNGMGSIETVSINLASGTGMRAVTQGELIRAEQQVGVVPTTQGMDGSGPGSKQQKPEEDEEMPHARGPEEIGAADMGPQPAGSGAGAGVGTEMHGIDVEAAVGRKAIATPLAKKEDDDGDLDDEPLSHALSPKREADMELDSLPPVKRAKSESGDSDMAEATSKLDMKGEEEEKKAGKEGEKEADGDTKMGNAPEEVQGKESSETKEDKGKKEVSGDGGDAVHPDAGTS